MLCQLSGWCGKHHFEILWEEVAGCKSGILPTANQLELGGGVKEIISGH